MRIAQLHALCLLANSAAAAQQYAMPGRVVDLLTGRGIPGVQIRPLSQDPQVKQTELTSGADGEFSYPGGLFSFRKPGYREVSVCCQSGRDAEGRESMRFLMIPQAELSGILLTSSGKAAGSRNIVMQRVGTSEDMRGLAYEEPRVIATDAMGRFRVQIDAVETDLLTALDDCSRFLLQRIRPMPGEQRSLRLTLPKPREYTVGGAISNYVPPFPDGEIRVRLAPVQRFGSSCPGVPDRVLPQSGGAFSIKGVSPGAYILTADLQAACRSDLCGGPVSSAYRRVEVTGQSLSHIDLAFHPTLEITGTTHWEDGLKRVFDYAEIDLDEESGVPHIQQSGESFQFSGMQPGKYALKVKLSQQHDFYLREARLDGQALLTDSITLGDGGKKTHLDLYFSANMAHLHVAGIDRDQRPIAHYVTVIFPQPEGPYTLWSPTGNALAPGRYFVLALQPDFPSFAIRPEILSAYMDRAVTVSLNPGQERTIQVEVVDAYPLAPPRVP